MSKPLHFPVSWRRVRKGNLGFQLFRYAIAMKRSLRTSQDDLFCSMKTLKLALSIAAVGLVGAQFAAADPRAGENGTNEVPQRDKPASSYHEPLAPAVTGTEKLVFVTGSHIPKKVQVKAIGTSTTSPVRVYTRAELDRTGRFTTQGILAQDPSITIIGNGSH